MMRSDRYWTVTFVVILLLLLLCLPLLLILTNDLKKMEAEYAARRRQDVKRACSIGTFLCATTWQKTEQVMCIERRHQCDGAIHCPYGEDEDNCKYLSASAAEVIAEAVLIKVVNPGNETLEYEAYGNCTIKEIMDDECHVCNLTHPTRVICKDAGLKDIPVNLRKSITRLNLNRNRIETINPETINTYTELEVLALQNNQIKSISDHNFESLTKLKRLFLTGNQIDFIHQAAFANLVHLTQLKLDNNHLKTFNTLCLVPMPSLYYLNVENNCMTSIGPEFPGMFRQFRWLVLSNNCLVKFTYTNLFHNLHTLHALDISSNKLKEIPKGLFNGSNLLELDISKNNLETVNGNTFMGLRSLTMLNLSYNALMNFPTDVFDQTPQLEYLDLRGLSMYNIDVDHFFHLYKLEHIYFSKFRYCMYAPNVRICHPFSDGVSSVEHLLVYPFLRFSVWIVALLTCVGNSTVLVWRTIMKKENPILSLLVKHLAVADFLMGVYLMIIGTHDVVFRNDYNKHALKWMASWQCTFSGFLALLSSELSVFIVTLITIERYRSITSNLRAITFRFSSTIVVLLWFFGIFLAVFPLLYWSNPMDRKYYASNGVCFPLHVEEPFMFGWQFSALVFIGINLPAVALIIILYCLMFVVIKRDRKKARPATRKGKEDMVLASRFFFIVLTDCLCWIPIILIKLLAFAEFEISSTIYAWLVVCILPINSALNPIIYTLAAPTEIRRRIKKRVMDCFESVRCMIGDDKKLEPGTNEISSSMCSHMTGATDQTRSSDGSVISISNFANLKHKLGSNGSCVVVNLKSNAKDSF